MHQQVNAIFHKIFKTRLEKFVLISFTLIFLVTAYFTNLKEIKSRYSNYAVICEIGIGSYFIYDVMSEIKSFFLSKLILTKNHTEYNKFLLDEHNKISSIYDDLIGNKKNLIYIQLESMDGQLLDLKYEGEPVMPFLSSLKNNSIYFANALDQTGPGRTADGELLATASLIPLANKPIYTTLDISNVPSLTKILNSQGYDTFSMHGFDGTFWNRKKNHERLGYKKTFFIDDLDKSSILGWGVSDKSLIEQASEKIIKADKPFFAHLILLTNHFPYNHVRGSEHKSFQNIVVDHYLSARYVDQSINNLFTTLEKNELLQNTVIVIYSDHDSGIVNKIKNYSDTDILFKNKNDKVIFLIYNNGKSKLISTPIGQVDIAPTALYELGIASPKEFIGSPYNSKESVYFGSNQMLDFKSTNFNDKTDAPVDLNILTKLLIHKSEEFTNEN